MTLYEFLPLLQQVKQSAGGYTARCPGHDDKKSSLHVAEGDDGRILIKCYAGCETPQIIAAMGLHLSDLFPARETVQHAEKRIVATYDYTDEHGDLVFQVVRYTPKDFRQRRPDPNNPSNWLWSLKGINRPLYNLPAVLKQIQENKKIFIVEGEKDVESLRALNLTATTNAGGASKWSPEYTKILSRATCIIIADNDDPGRKHAELIHQKLPDSAILHLPGPEHSDVTDWINNGGTKAELIDLAREALQSKPKPKPANDETPFTALGFNHDHYYFLSHRTGQVVSLSTAAMARKTSFLQLAPLQWWEINYGSERGADWTGAADAIMTQCQSAGLFSLDKTRGRGAWLDDARVVLHQGDSLIVDGEQTGLFDLSTDYVYERAQRLSIPHAEPLTDDQAHRLIEICDRLPWEYPSSSAMLAGWLVVAPICGAMTWRPHLWLTGPAGSGKTWTMDHVIHPVLGSTALHVQSATTEAGLRQALGCDARPVLFDEAENEDLRAQGRMQRVLELARQASSESGAVIVKGSTTGETIRYQIRSCFLLSSIVVGVTRRADETRITTLSFRNPERSDRAAARFADLRELTRQTITTQWCGGLLARSCKLAHTIRHNAEILAQVVSQALGGRRSGDQIGTMLAGHYSLRSSAQITHDEAEKYVAELCLEDFRPDEHTRDEVACLTTILTHRVRIEDGYGKPAERTIGELIEAVRGENHDLNQSSANATLRRRGIRADQNFGLEIATNHSAIREMLAGSPWETNWSLVLRRLESATASRNAVKFAGGVVSKVTCIPWKHVYTDTEQREYDQAVPF